MESARISFHTLKERTVYDKIPLTMAQLKELIDRHQPSEIYNSHYSDTKPFIVITEYIENGFLQYCTGSADKTPNFSNIYMLFKELRCQGFEDCYFTIHKP